VRAGRTPIKEVKTPRFFEALQGINIETPFLTQPGIVNAHPAKMIFVFNVNPFEFWNSSNSAFQCDLLEPAIKKAAALALMMNQESPSVVIGRSCNVWQKCVQNTVDPSFSILISVDKPRYFAGENGNLSVSVNWSIISNQLEVAKGNIVLQYQNQAHC